MPEKEHPLHLQETINNRLAMLGVVSGLAAEFGSGMGIKQQIAAEPLGVIATFVIFAYATYIPIMRGYTRKEPFENAVFTAKVGSVWLGVCWWLVCTLILRGWHWQAASCCDCLLTAGHCMLAPSWHCLSLEHFLPCLTLHITPHAHQCYTARHMVATTTFVLVGRELEWSPSPAWIPWHGFDRGTLWQEHTAVLGPAVVSSLNPGKSS